MAQVARVGRALLSPFMLVGRGYNQLAAKYPFTTGIVTTTLKTSAADAFAQLVMEKREKLDWRRHFMFCTFGFAYLGCWQYYLYNNLFVKWCASITKVVGHAGSAPIKTFIDQGIHHPFIYFPCFYLLKGHMEDAPPMVSLHKCKEDMWENLKALWSVWVPAQMVNFTLVPLHLRIPFVAGVSFAWTVIISVMRGALDAPPSKGQEPSAPTPMSSAVSSAVTAPAIGTVQMATTAASSSAAA